MAIVVRDRADSTQRKIKPLEELAQCLRPLRTVGKKIVHCHGVFDLLHIGHIRHLQQARTLGDVLVVTVTPDRHVNKGPHRPAFTEDLRAEAIAALDCVTYVAVNEWPTAVEAIHLLQPDFYVKGSDYIEAENDRTGGITLEKEALSSVGGQLAFTEDIIFSSSNLINRHLSIFPKEVTEHLQRFCARYYPEDVLRYLEGAQSLKVLIVGETIIDEYHYCETMGKSGKEPILAARQVNVEKFAGGTLAIANQVAAFCDQVSLLTFLGSHDSQEEFIREKLDAKIHQRFLYMESGPTIVKRRFVEVYPFQKLFETYVMNDGESNPSESRALCATLREVLPEYDVVIVVDYGHGMIGTEAVDLLCKHSRFLAVNTQVNAGNHGFNTISKYPRADYICVSESEIRLDVRSRRRDLQVIVREVAEKLQFGRAVITQGPEGCLCYSQEEGFFQVPAFASQVVDRMGAGDAVLSLTALCVAQQAPMEVVGFIGNVAGAEAVATVGHRKFIERVPFYKHIESLLK
jgi:rfaE bifunctional protein kinase chain/domain/rfaE bifunctional protein nucleotidyltransferase chain/domain